MAKFTNLVLASALAIVVPAGAVMADDASKNSGAAGNMNSNSSVKTGQSQGYNEDGVIDPTTSGSVTNSTGGGMMLGASDLNSWSGDNVSVVKLDTITDESRRTQLEGAKGGADFQWAMTSNTAIKSKLDAQNIKADDVVAAERGADGQLIVYVR
ncbi:hypothetical protein [Rhizobium sp. FKL33]|uniref:hypothetical protein n=1 Tax=Rhizobium sp. FKL33 TaxID=2562307 RepID=UPI0010C0DCC7|nr:hypothetical protein [Rhizobium sp. FKL33]